MKDSRMRDVQQETKGRQVTGVGLGECDLYERIQGLWKTGSCNK